MEMPGMRLYALKAGEGWAYHDGIDFTVKASELGQGRHVAVLEYTTRRGEEPPEHTHPTVDEIFYVLQGSITFQRGDAMFEVEDGGFVFLPRGVPHGFTIRSDGDVRLLAITSPAQEDVSGGWGGFVADIDAGGARRAAPPKSE